MNKCIFLDRDGNINVEKDYLHKVEDFEFESGSLEAIKIFKELGYMVVVVTNQSGVARGYYSEEDVHTLHEYLAEKALEAGGEIDAFYYCPHHPEKGLGRYKQECDCRKPGPGMFWEAQKKLDVDFETSMVIGDKMSDVKAGKNLGMRGILVRTGHGKKEELKAEKGTEIYDSLYDFALKLKRENENK